MYVWLLVTPRSGMSCHFAPVVIGALWALALAAAMSESVMSTAATSANARGLIVMVTRRSVVAASCMWFSPRAVWIRRVCATQGRTVRTSDDSGTWHIPSERVGNAGYM